MIVLYTTLAFLAALMIAYTATSLIIQIAEQKHVFDIPDARKLHIKPTPVLGGIAIFSGFWIAGLLFSDIANIQYLIAATLFLTLIGITDDLIELSASKKFITQFVVAAILFFAGFQLQGFYGFLGFEQVHPILSFSMTLLFLVVLTNAYNLIDGIDGLAGSLGLIGAVVFGILFSIIGATSWSILSFALAGGIIGFLRFNFYGASIFMGDTGSTFIGLILGVLSIQFLNTAYYSVGLTQAPIIVGAIIFIPVMDLVRVFGVRVLQGLSPFYADRRHIHHILLDQAGLKTTVICTVLGSLNILFVLIASQTSLSMITGLLLYSAIVLTLIFSVKLYNGKINTQTNRKQSVIKMHPRVESKTSA